MQIVDAPIPTTLYVAGIPVTVLDEFRPERVKKFRHYRLGIQPLPWGTALVARMPRRADPIFLSRLAAEYAVLEDLVHPALPHVFAEVDDGHSLRGFVTEELVFPSSGRWERLYDGGLTLETFLVHAEELCEGLAWLHARGRTHGDVTLGNTAFRPGHEEGDWTAVLADLEWSGRLNEPAHSLSTGNYVFTPAYASLEQIHGLPITPAAEVAALAVTLLSVLTGVEGYAARSVKKSIENAGQPCLPREMWNRLHALPIPADLKVLLCRARYPDVTRRPKDALEFLHLLERIRALCPMDELARPIPIPL
ncbi:hypothetical protein HYW18_03455 [Candidatus Uhrbacteria bacterium]|nr:hypothetical protein [Candidatus Uhrbacteria bacterium]